MTLKHSCTQASYIWLPILQFVFLASVRDFSTTDGGGGGVGDLDKKPLLEANLANEVATTVLDLVELFIQHFKVSVKILFFPFSIYGLNTAIAPC